MTDEPNHLDYPLVVASTACDGEVASTERSTPDGYVPGGVAGYIVGECTVLCPACADGHPDVHEHPDDTDLHAYDYDYIGGMDEWDYPGATCDHCLTRLDTNVLLNSWIDVEEAGVADQFAPEVEP